MAKINSAALTFTDVTNLYCQGFPWGGQPILETGDLYYTGDFLFHKLVGDEVQTAREECNVILRKLT